MKNKLLVLVVLSLFMFIISSCNNSKDENISKPVMQEKQVSISLGVLWEEKTNDLESLLKKADKLMYQEKERYHQQRR